MTADPYQTLITRLRKIVAIDHEDEEAIRNLTLHLKSVEPDADIVREGDIVEHCCLIIEGFTYRYRSMRDGKRQIIAFHIPGDVPDLHSLQVRHMDHSFCAATASTVAFIPHDSIWSLCLERPQVMAALWLETLIDAAIFRERIVGLGRRNSEARVAHLICELAVRLTAVELSLDGVHKIPLTQTEIADALGLTVVTVNRALKDLKVRGLVDRDRSRLVILDWRRLSELGEFDPAYLHLRHDEWDRIFLNVSRQGSDAVANASS